jgi:acetyl-CoA C-acetyltransferase
MAKPAPVYILSGTQTDFARNWLKEGTSFLVPIREAVLNSLTAANVEPREIQSAHVGNFGAELYTHQGHIGAFMVEVDPVLRGLPTARHEAACASGSIAILAASAEIEAGRYDLECVVGIEQMKTVDSVTGGDYLGTAAWYERESKGVEYPFPKLFGRLGDEYDKRFGLKDEHLARIAAINFANARRNPQAQTREWFVGPGSEQREAKMGQPVAGRLRVRDCSQVTDGAAALILASERYAAQWAKRNGKRLDAVIDNFAGA